MDFLLIIILLFSVLLVRRLFFIQNRNTELIEKIPGPKSYPIIGNFFDIAEPTNKTLGSVLQRIKQYGKIHKLWFGNMPLVAVSAPELVEPILSSSKEIKKSFIYRFAEDWLGSGLLTSSGARWFKHRKLITPTFHFNILDSFISVYESNSVVLIDKLMKKARSGEPFDIYPYITLAALDIICETAMGINLNAQNGKDHKYIAAIYRFSNLLSLRVKKFYLHPDFIYHRTKNGKEYLQCLKTLHEFTEATIKERKELRLKEKQETVEENYLGIKKKKAFLDLLLDLPNDLTDNDLREEVDTFMFEGHDTTTAGICYAIYLLGLHPKIQEEAAEEVLRLWPEGEALTMQMLNEMKLVERVLKETLRIYPSVPFISREVQNDIKIGEYLIPAETTVSIQIVALHRDHSIWPDPMKFDPDRFLAENVKERHPYAYVPFSAGSRNCIGQKFAILEEKAVMASLLRAFTITSLVRPEDMVLVTELILRPQDGIQIKLSPRK